MPIARPAQMVRVSTLAWLGGLSMACGDPSAVRDVQPQTFDAGLVLDGSVGSDGFVDTTAEIDVGPSAPDADRADLGWAVDSGSADAGRRDVDDLDTGLSDVGAPGRFNCTLVVGYSQVGQNRGGWFVTGGVFESMVDDGRWQLLWNSGGGVDRWQRSGYVGWSRAIQSACTSNRDRPDRVLLSVSGPYGSDISAWVDAIRATLVEIRRRFPSVGTIVLQPVVGGPSHQTCSHGGAEVRASWQHAFIDQAIAIVAGPGVEVGASPEVQSCSDYRDSTGHLTVEAAESVGQLLGTYYR